MVLSEQTESPLSTSDCNGEDVPRPDASVSSLILSEYRAVWAEFYEWNQKYCQDAISRLGKPKHTAHELDVHFGKWSQVPSQGDQALSFDVSDFTSSQTRHTRVPVETIECLPFEPHPSYESATPCSQNIFHGDDPDDMPFIPFADDPRFDHVDHTSSYKRLAWQGGNDQDWNPDLDVIVLETVFRLQSTHKLSFAQIDSTGVLPRTIVPRPGSGKTLSHTIRQRDFPGWPGATFTPSFLDDLQVMHRPPSTDLRSRLESLTSTFCANLNCVQSYCIRHLEPMPMRPTKVPKLPDIQEGIRACGSDCFLLNDVSSMSPTPWSPSDEETLGCLLNVALDLNPCGLSILCRKPCWEVNIYREQIISDGQASRQRLHLYQSQESLDPDELCDHVGPCDSAGRCACARNHRHCLRNCTCDMTCKRRWSGCRCESSGTLKACQPEQCRCYRAGRECDPELCQKCVSRGNVLVGVSPCLSVHMVIADVTADICQNSSLQQGRRKKTVVKSSLWGVGLYLAEPARENELIAEYVGEIIYEPTALSRDSVAEHRGRNYLFGLDATFSIDSTFAGNDTRYINHGSSHVANCIARVTLVNGESRIGIYALRDLEVGSELRLDYGDRFFLS